MKIDIEAFKDKTRNNSDLYVFADRANDEAFIYIEGFEHLTLDLIERLVDYCCEDRITVFYQGVEYKVEKRMKGLNVTFTIGDKV